MFTNANKKEMELSELVYKFTILLYIVVLSLIYWRSLSFAINAISPFDPDPLDGTFQLLNSIRRLLDGQKLGEDYVVFHGPLWQILNVPAYVLGGKSVIALEFSKFLINSFILPFISGICVLLICKESKIKWLSSCIVMLAIQFFVDFNTLVLTSSLGQRASVGILIITMYCLALKSKTKLSQNLILLSVGVIISLSIDQGIWAYVSGCLTMLIFGYYSSNRQIKWTLFNQNLNFLLLPIVSLLAVFYILSGFSTRAFWKSLEFYFKEISSAQRWFFGAWPQKSIESWKDLLNDAYIGTLAILISLSFIIYIVLKLSQNVKINNDREIFDIYILQSGIFGLFSTLNYFGGISASHYLIPLEIIIFVSLAVLMANSGLKIEK